MKFTRNWLVKGSLRLKLTAFTRPWVVYSIVMILSFWLIYLLKFRFVIYRDEDNWDKSRFEWRRKVRFRKC